VCAGGASIIATVNIYTKTGDAGETSLFDGTRVSKHDARVAAYGDVDELQASLGVAAAAGGLSENLLSMVTTIQRDLFALGAQLADPRHKIAARVTKAEVSDARIAQLEAWIDALEAELPPLRHFILSGGTAAGAGFHLSRTVCRRAERSVIGLGAEATDPVLRIYLNRLSDLLFVIARFVNHRAGVPEIKW
jgi:cob(I)alamin adenosyltransferase